MKDFAKLTAAFLLTAFVVANVRSSEPPPSNLPPVTAGGVCKCGVSCPCGDQVTVAVKPGAVSSTWPKAAPKTPAYAVQKRYFKIGNKRYVEDVFVEVSQPASVSYAVPAQNVSYQSPKLDCSSGRCVIR